MNRFFESTQSVLIIAELANAHEGRPELARELVRQACQTGADIIKSQLYYGSELVVSNHPRCSHFTDMEMPKEVWSELVTIAHDAGLLFYADVLGLEAAKLGVECGIDGFKVHSSDTFNIPLLDFLDQQKRPVLLSCGGTKWIEIKWALEHLSQLISEGMVALMHGFQSFPTKIDDSHLAWIKEYQLMFNLPVGLMDHLDAEDPMSITLPLLGVSAGAGIIEKHITLDRGLKGIDYFSSLHPDEFAEMVRLIRRSEIAVGTLPVTMSQDELDYRKKMKKVLASKKSLASGECLNEEDITFKRGDFKENSLYYQEALGKKLKHALECDEIVTNMHFKQKVGILIAVRMHSTRFSQKALKVICGQTTTEHLIDRVKLSRLADIVILCTSEESLDDPLSLLAEKKDIPCIRGSASDVMARFLKAVEQYELDVIVRVTGDDILVDPVHIDLAIDYHLRHNNDYTDCKALPGGTEGEVISVSALRRAYEMAEDSSYSEYMTFYFNNEHFFRIGSLPVASYYQRDWRLTIDYPEDFELVRTILEGIYNDNQPYSMDELIEFVEQHPELLRINCRKQQKKLSDNINTRLQLYK